MAGDENAMTRHPAFRSGLAVAIGTALYGISFGALAVAAGLDIWQTCFLSLVMCTGGSQFALIGVLASGGSTAGLSAITSAALLGVRNVVYGMRMKPVVFTGSLVQRVGAVWLTIDEPTAVALAQRDERGARIGFWVTGIVVFVGWNIMTFVGALIGDAMGDTRAWGLDAAAAAAFLGLLWPRVRGVQAGAVAAVAAVAAAITTPVLAPGLPVLVAAGVAVAMGWSTWSKRRSRAIFDEQVDE